MALIGILASIVIVVLLVVLIIRISVSLLVMAVAVVVMTLLPSRLLRRVSRHDCVLEGSPVDEILVSYCSWLRGRNQVGENPSQDAIEVWKIQG
tara:strand:- start:499 stop:780 length:282 start_codon:yes stop_codon:yes gene_type:complete